MTNSNHPPIEFSEYRYLKHGDCLEIMSTLPDECVDMVLCDLPYGTTACPWDSALPLGELWGHYRRVCKKNAAIVLTATQPFTSILVSSNFKMFKHEWIWHKSKCGSAFTAKYRPMTKHESVLVFCKASPKYRPQMTSGGAYSRTRHLPPINNHKFGLGKKPSTTVNTGTRYPDSVIFFQQKWRRQDQMHPTQKPVALCEYLIRTYTDDGDTVLDNCMGSGTTGVACRRLNRKFIGIEKDAIYFDTAQKRINEAFL